MDTVYLQPCAAERVTRCGEVTAASGRELDVRQLVSRLQED
jgi:hypothetical protein